jgi:hypothetical protein
VSEETALVVVAAFAIVVLGAVLIYVLTGIKAERDDWQQERRFLIDRAIARHTGEVVALDKMEDRRQNGAPEPRERVPTMPEGL